MLNINCSNYLKREIEKFLIDSEKSVLYTSDEQDNILSRANFILESLFKNEYGRFDIPYEFIDSELGKKLLEIKYEYGGVNNFVLESGQEFFTSNELSIIAGITRQAIAYQVKQGNIKSASEDKRIILIKRDEVLNYLSGKLKLDKNDVKKIVEYYEHIKDSTDDHAALTQMVKSFKNKKGVFDDC